MVTPLARHQTYEPLRIATATRHRVPIRTGVDVDEIIGRRRVEAVVLSDGSRIDCDTVVFTGDWIPDHELARRSGSGDGGRIAGAGRRRRASARATGRVRDRQPGAPRRDGGRLRARRTRGRGRRQSVARRRDELARSGPDHGRRTDPLGSSHRARHHPARRRVRLGRYLVLEADGRTVWTSRSRHLVPNRSITIPRRDAGAATPLHVRFLGAHACPRNADMKLRCACSHCVHIANTAE